MKASTRGTGSRRQARVVRLWRRGRREECLLRLRSIQMDFLDRR